MINVINKLIFIFISLILCANMAMADFYWHEPDANLCEINEDADPLNAKEADFNMFTAMQIMETNGLFDDYNGVPDTIIELTLMRMHALAIRGELQNARKNNDSKKVTIYLRYYNTYKNNFCNKLKDIVWPS